MFSKAYLTCGKNKDIWITAVVTHVVADIDDVDHVVIMDPAKLTKKDKDSLFDYARQLAHEFAKKRNMYLCERRSVLFEDTPNLIGKGRNGAGYANGDKLSFRFMTKEL
jgi:hypothetical protein